jgi:3-dehydroquinate dehydratase II
LKIDNKFMKQKIIIINGPNLNLLGKREPEIYGTLSFEAYFETLKTQFAEIDLFYFQSNHEGDLLDKIHEVGFSYDGVIINAGAIADAITAVKTPAIEVHISNIHARESFRHHSFLAQNCVGSIVGLGLKGYALAIDFFINKQH